MKPGSEEWFREVSENLVADYHVTDCGPLDSYIESALRRVFNAACDSNIERLLMAAETWRSMDKRLFPLAVIRSEECEAQAENIRALKVKT